MKPHVPYPTFPRILATVLLLAAAVYCSRGQTASRLLPTTDEPTADADAAASRAYTHERPLIYEGAQDLWPYSFLNENGQPDGFNIDLIKLIMERIDIPYEIRMKPRLMAFNDLKEGNSDLMIDLTAGFHEEYGHYSENTVTLFTQSVLSPRSHPTEITKFRDLADHRVYVNDSSLCHHLMVDYGWGANAIPTSNISETILQMSVDEEGQLVWNTLSLKWLLHKFNIDNLVITPINMPHGEYKFMSNDVQLLHRIDSVYTVLNSTDKLTPLHNKWFYPERKDEPTPKWVWYLCGGAGFLLLLLLIYWLNYRTQARRITRENNMRNRRLALILETSGVRVWTYDIDARMFTWRNEFGQPAYVYTPDEFASRYSPEDYDRLTGAMSRLATTKPQPDGSEEEIRLDIQAKDAREDGDTEMHDFIIALSVLRRDKSGRPTILIGTKKDVTEKRNQQRQAYERTLRYWALFNIPMMGIIFFDEKGYVANINQKACDIYHADRDELLERHLTYHDLLGIDDLDISQADGFYATYIMEAPTGQKRYNEFRLLTVLDDDGQLIGMFAICQDVTHTARQKQTIEAAQQRLEAAQRKEKAYIATINEFIHQGAVRLVSYSPENHTFTIFDADNHVQHSLTQTRIMTLVNERVRKKTMHIISKMDGRENITIETSIMTSLHVRGLWLHLYLNLLPQLDKDGVPKEYIGVLRDISELKAREQELAQVKARTQEVEDTKNSFVKNVMHEIRHPLDTIVSQTERLKVEGVAPDEEDTTQTIIRNAEQLTHIIGNILYLSRIEAHMVELVKKPVDFAAIFASFCENGWRGHKVLGVRYNVENPYEQLVIDIDQEHLGNIIVQIAMNAAQHTQKGAIRARYEYIGRRLMITIDDTGTGIAREQMRQLVAQLESGVHTNSGLGLPICKELLKQMGGTLEISSEPEVGTTVWITLPCTATAIRRKKLE